MKVGFIGLGKLGLPVALAIHAAGHEVMGFDVSPAVMKMVSDRRAIPYREEGAQELLDAASHLTFMLGQPSDIVKWADLVFVAVQTPHQPEYEGITPLPETRADFDYGHLWNAVETVKDAQLVVVISTVLPGTIERVIFDGLVPPEHLLYNPAFIAMGTTIHDFRDPEFVLIGTDGAWPGPLQDLYRSIHRPHVKHVVTTIKTAELTKVAYNTFIGLKIAFANTMMELCEKTGADVDDLVDALSLGTRRIISPAYMRGGMGDGGGCHPRDNIALSWLAREHHLSYDLFEAIMVCRQAQTAWLAGITEKEWAGWGPGMQNPRPVEVLGKAYKPNTALTVGSPALLFASYLDYYGVDFTHTDPYDASDGDDA